MSLKIPMFMYGVGMVIQCLEAESIFMACKELYFSLVERE
jgi:hypothetical protein